jgi:hypothetical protein
MTKEFLSGFAIILTIVAFLPYIRSIKLGKTKPHVFSWIIWGITTVIASFAQFSDNAGVGAWPIFLSGIITLYIGYLAYTKKSDITVTKSDWLFFISALLSLPFWYLTSDPLWAIVILTTVDTLGFVPTFRKAYSHPFDEGLLFFILMAIRNVIATAALDFYSVTTVLFPVTIAIVCFIFISMVIIRRKKLKDS